MGELLHDDPPAELQDLLVSQCRTLQKKHLKAPPPSPAGPTVCVCVHSRRDLELLWSPVDLWPRGHQEALSLLGPQGLQEVQQDRHRPPDRQLLWTPAVQNRRRWSWSAHPLLTGGKITVKVKCGNYLSFVTTLAQASLWGKKEVREEEGGC